jgi:uncharacterized phiE125 gp8 family phage protein
MTPVLITPPAAEPIDVAEVQTHLRVSGQTAEITRLIKAARGVVERYLNRALITQTWDAYYRNWCELKLPYPPLELGTVQTPTPPVVYYRDLDGNEQTLSSSLYHLTKDEPAEIVRKYDTTWPELQYGHPQPVRIRVVVGYGAAGSAVPEEIKHAMKLIITDLYENRGTVVLGNVAKIPNYITDLIHSYKIYHF